MAVINVDMRRFNKSAGLATNPTRGGFCGISIGGLMWARNIYDAGGSEYRTEEGRIRLRENSSPQRLHQVK